MCAVQRDLDSCYRKLTLREAELQERILALGENAVAYKRGKNLAAARKKMMERARVMAQLEKIQNSIAMIDMHRSTIEGTALDLSVLETLKASGDALKQLGATKQGLSAVEEIVADVESNLNHAAEITSVLSSGSVTGMVNTMSIHGAVVDEDELMRELDMMSEAAADAEGVEAEAGSNSTRVTLSSTNSITGSSTIKSILQLPSIAEEPSSMAHVKNSSDAASAAFAAAPTSNPVSENRIYAAALS